MQETPIKPFGYQDIKKGLKTIYGYTSEFKKTLFFIFFLIVFAVAFFLLVFLVDRNLNYDLRILLIRIGILATVSSLFYNLLVQSDPEMVE